MGKKVSLTDAIYCLEGEWNKRRECWNSRVQMWKEKGVAAVLTLQGGSGWASVNLDGCLAWVLMNL